MTMPDNTATTLLAELAERERESRTSVALRDTLLPKLISGELRVSVWQDRAGFDNCVGQKVAPCS